MKKPNYYKEAFLNIFNLLFLLSVIICAVAAIKPVVIAGLIMEFAYMLAIPNTLIFKRYTNQKKGITEPLNPEKARRKKILELPPNMRPKAEKLIKKYKEIMKIASKKQNIDVMMADELEKSEYLLDNYINFSNTLAGYKDYLLNNNPNIIKEDIRKLKHRIETVFDGLDNNLDRLFTRTQKRTMLIENIEILEKRLDKINQMVSLSESLQTQLDVMENTFYLVGDHIMSFSPGENLDIDLKSIVSGVESTEQVVKNTYEEMEKVKKLKTNRLME